MCHFLYNFFQERLDNQQASLLTFVQNHFGITMIILINCVVICSIPIITNYCFIFHSIVIPLSKTIFSSVSIQTLAPQGKGLIGEYINLDLPNISTSLAYVLDLEVLTVITGSLAHFFYWIL
jgi:hypothetical protein